MSAMTAAAAAAAAPLDVLMIGTGEYTTGYVGGGASNSDKVRAAAHRARRH